MGKGTMLLLCLFDIAFTCIFITPFTVGFWRGIWEYVNYYPLIYSNGWVLLWGTVLQLSYAIIQDMVIEKYHKSLSYDILTRVYIYIFGIINVVSWRSLWGMLDELIGFDSDMNIITTFCSVILLAVLRGIINIGSVPFYIGMDHKPENVFPFATMFKTTVSKPKLYFKHNHKIISHKLTGIKLIKKENITIQSLTMKIFLLYH